MKREDIFGYLFSTSSRFYRRAINHELQKYDLTITQCGVIRTLSYKEELTQAEIADYYSSDRATIGSVIQKLTQKNFLEKKLSNDDRRAYVVKLTPKAREIAEEIEKASNEIEKKALTGLTQEEIKNLYKALNVIIQNLSEDAGTTQE